MGTVYESIVTCIGYILFFGAIIMVMLGFFMETGGLDDWKLPKPQEPEIYDAAYIILEGTPSLHLTPSAKHIAAS